MRLSITKNDLVFVTQIAVDNCTIAKQLAVASDFVFELVIPEPTDNTTVKFKSINAAVLYALLVMDEASKNSIINFYKTFDITINLDNFNVTHLSVSCHGKVNILIHAPSIDSGINLFSPTDSLKIGVGFSFQSALRFSENDMVCIN